MTEIATLRHRNVDWAVSTVRDARSSPATEAVQLGAVDGIAATIDDVLAFANGKTVQVGGQAQTLDLTGATVTEVGMNPFLAFLHLLCDPNIAVLLFTAGSAASSSSSPPELRHGHPRRPLDHPGPDRARDACRSTSAGSCCRPRDRPARAGADGHEPWAPGVGGVVCVRAGRVRAVHRHRWTRSGRRCRSRRRRSSSSSRRGRCSSR